MSFLHKGSQWRHLTLEVVSKQGNLRTTLSSGIVNAQILHRHALNCGLGLQLKYLHNEDMYSCNNVVVIHKVTSKDYSHIEKYKIPTQIQNKINSLTMDQLVNIV